jgi:hypothetical protein
MSGGAEFFVSVMAVLSDDGDIVVPFVEECTSILRQHYDNYELVLVDDGSTDDTKRSIEALLAQHDAIRYVLLSRRFGREAAIGAGFDTVIGDVIVVLDVETDPPELIPAMVEQVRSVNGVVRGIIRNRSEIMSRGYILGAHVYHQLCRLLLEFPPPPNADYFIGLTRETLNATIRLSSGYQYPLLRVVSPQIGFNTSTFEYHARPVRKGRVRRSLLEAIRDAVASIITNSTKPLRITTYGTTALAGLHLVWRGFDALTGRAPFEAVFQAGLIFLMVVNFTLAMEYLVTLLNASRAHPSYFIAEERNSSVLLPGLRDKRNVRTERSAR